jgi:DNA-binding CsgD family transcriptional regulator
MRARIILLSAAGKTNQQIALRQQYIDEYQ